MGISRKGFLKSAGAAAILSLSLAIAGCASSGSEGGVTTASSASTKPIARGQKIVMATHSFNVFISTDPDRPTPTRTQVVAPGGGAETAPAAGAAAQRPDPCNAPSRATAGQPTGTPLLTKLTNEAGLAGQEFLAVQMIGGSTPMQHWNQCGGDETRNIAKAALLANGDKVDVFTMSPNARMPEEGIDLFGDLVIKHNPNARILVQASWSAYDGNGTTASVGGSGGGNFKNEQRDAIDAATLDRWLSGQETRGDAYLPRLRAQLEGIDKRAGKQITYVVPSSTAVYTLRKEVLAGHVPGVTKQSELTRDPIGHPTRIQANLIAYVWYASMYRKSPVGLQAFVTADDPNSAKRERILQQIAWNAVVGEPKSGVKGKPVVVGS